MRHKICEIPEHRRVKWKWREQHDRVGKVINAEEDVIESFVFGTFS